MKLDLGPDGIRQLIPHRPPLCLVDRVTAYEPGERPSLNACLHVDANHPVFLGHFPGLALWPGVYTIEGMGQSTNLLGVLDALGRRLTDLGHGLEVLPAVLAALEPRLDPTRRAPSAEHRGIAKRLREEAQSHLALSAKVDVRLVRPVLAGVRLDYRVALNHRQGDVYRFDVEARTKDGPVASGVMTAGVLPDWSPP